MNTNQAYLNKQVIAFIESDADDTLLQSDLLPKLYKALEFRGMTKEDFRAELSRVNKERRDKNAAKIKRTANKGVKGDEIPDDDGPTKPTSAVTEPHRGTNRHNADTVRKPSKWKGKTILEMADERKIK